MCNRKVRNALRSQSGCARQSASINARNSPDASLTPALRAGPGPGWGSLNKRTPECRATTSYWRRRRAVVDNDNLETCAIQSLRLEAGQAGLEFAALIQMRNDDCEQRSIQFHVSSRPKPVAALRAISTRSDVSSMRGKGCSCVRALTLFHEIGLFPDLYIKLNPDFL